MLFALSILSLMVGTRLLGPRLLPMSCPDAGQVARPFASGRWSGLVLPARVRCNGGSELRGEAALLLGKSLDLNSATADELRAVPGMPRGVADAVVEDRLLRGRFTTVSALLRVPGVGPVRFEKWRPHFRVGTSGAPRD